MGGCLVFIFALVSLGLLWPASQSILWWSILTVAVLMFIANTILKSLNNMAREKYLRQNPELRGQGVLIRLSDYDDEFRTPAKVGFFVSVFLTVSTVVLSVAGIVLAVIYFVGG